VLQNHDEFLTNHRFVTGLAIVTEDSDFEETEATMGMDEYGLQLADFHDKGRWTARDQIGAKYRVCIPCQQ
jgi:hypothetical protein